MNKKIKFCQLLLMLLIVWPITAKCDLGSSDIITIDYNGTLIHLPIPSQGLLKNNDLCYYDYDGEYIGEVKDIIKNYLPPIGSYNRYYLTLSKINLKNIPLSFESERILYILRDPVSFEPDSVLASLNIISAVNDVSNFNMYSPDLNEEDNLWLESNSFELVFTSSVDGCDFSMYTIKGKMTESEKEDIQKRILTLMKGNEGQLYNEEINKLYRKKVLMLGFCSC